MFKISASLEKSFAVVDDTSHFDAKRQTASFELHMFLPLCQFSFLFGGSLAV